MFWWTTYPLFITANGSVHICTIRTCAIKSSPKIAHFPSRKAIIPSDCAYPLSAMHFPPWENPAPTHVSHEAEVHGGSHQLPVEGEVHPAAREEGPPRDGQRGVHVAVAVLGGLPRVVNGQLGWAVVVPEGKRQNGDLKTEFSQVRSIDQSVMHVANCRLEAPTLIMDSW
jgi:hypothetical protein